jgi:hypothetical protein
LYYWLDEFQAAFKGGFMNDERPVFRMCLIRQHEKSDGAVGYLYKGKITRIHGIFACLV